MMSSMQRRDGSRRAGGVPPGTWGLVLGALLAVTPAAGAQLSFSDQTDAAGLTTTHNSPPGPVTVSFLGGAAAADFDADGACDLFVPTGGIDPDRLFMNDGLGGFVDQAAAWGADLVHKGSGAAVGDYDNDGRLDLFVSSLGDATQYLPGEHVLYHNRNGRFVDRAPQAGVNYTSPIAHDGYGAAFGDIDLDGDLDLFVTGWQISGFGNCLFRNNGDGTFTDVTTSRIAADLEPVRGYSPLIVDMDGDRWPEILIAGDFGTSRYLVNVGNGSFVDSTAASGTGLDSHGMGGTVGDFNNDGKLDWYVTSIDNDDGLTFSGNMLYLNQGGHVYTETSEDAGCNNGGWGWGVSGADLDHDGWLDIAENNGWPGPIWSGQPVYLWMSDGPPGTYSESAAALGINLVTNGRGLATFDSDADGDQDIVFIDHNGPLKFYRNDLTGPSISWLQVRLDNGGSSRVAPNGYGAVLKVTTGPKTQMRVMTGGGSFLSQNDLVAHFGLQIARSVDEVRVEWPDGRVQVVSDVAINQTLTITYDADVDAEVEQHGGSPVPPGGGGNLPPKKQ